MIKILKNVWKDIGWPLVGVSIIISFFVFLCSGLVAHENKLKEKIKNGVSFTPKLCEQRCAPLAVSYFANGFILINYNDKFNEQICRANTSNCQYYFEEACACGNIGKK